MVWALPATMLRPYKQFENHLNKICNGIQEVHCPYKALEREYTNNAICFISGVSETRGIQMVFK